MGRKQQLIEMAEINKGKFICLMIVAHLKTTKYVAVESKGGKHMKRYLDSHNYNDDLLSDKNYIARYGILSNDTKYRMILDMREK